MPKGDEDGVKDMEKETIQFHEKTGTVSWIDFEKSIARYFRMKFGSADWKLAISFGETNCP
jgi:hypothetical protein